MPMSASASHPTPLDRAAARVALAAIVVGVVLRIWVLTQRGSLGLDEASLALNVLGRDFGGLARPLDWGQAAPAGFLWLEKGLTTVLGPAEWVLRLWPAVAGAGTLVVVWIAGRRLVRPCAAALTVTVLAFSLLALRYSAEAKPYASDAFVAVALVGFALQVLDEPASLRRWMLLGVAGTIGVLISLPSAFVLAAIGAALVRDAWRQRAAVRTVAFGTGALWLATFGVLWLLVIQESSGGEYLREYWAPVMLDRRASDFSARMIGAVASTVATPVQWIGSVPLALGLVALWFVGVVLVVRRDWRIGLLAAGPFAVAALASIAGVYPLSDRLAYFAAPLALLVAAEPVGQLITGLVAHLKGAVATSALAYAAAILLAAGVGMDGAQIIRAPGSLEPTRALFAGVKASADSSGAGVYVFARAVPAWAYATTDWASTNRERVSAFLEAAGSTDSPGHENFARVGGVTDGEGEGLVTRAEHALRNGRSAFVALEFVGLGTGVRYRIAGPTSIDGPSLGWAEEEARRVSMIVDGTFAGTAWVVASHFFEDSSRDELRPLVEAIKAKGLQVVEERRGGRDAVALRIVAPPAAAHAR